MVKRTINRPPSPQDPWWSDHQSKCGGIFRKIWEPDKKGKGKGVGGRKGKEITSGIRDLLKGRGQGKTSSDEPSVGVSPPSVSAFKGKGFVVGEAGAGGVGESSSDLKSKMLLAAEKRRADNVQSR